MRNAILFCLLCTTLAIAAPGPGTPEAVVRAYTDAANRHDLDAFLALYAPGIRKFRFPGEQTSQGIEHNRAVYTRPRNGRLDMRAGHSDI